MIKHVNRNATNSAEVGGSFSVPLIKLYLFRRFLLLPIVKGVVVNKFGDHDWHVYIDRDITGLLAL